MRLGFLLLLILGVALFEPNSFRFVAQNAIRLEAWRHGVTARIGAVDGSLLEPLTLRDSVWIYESATGPVTRVEIAAATAEFSWRNLLPRSSGRWFQRLTITGLTGKIQFPTEAADPAATGGFPELKIPRPQARLFSAPERVEARNVDLIFQSHHDYVRIGETEFVLSNVEAGTIRAGQLVIKQPWLNRTFRNVRGTTAMQETKVEIASLALEPGVEMQSLSAELDDLARGRLDLDIRLAAFDGEMRIAVQTLSQEHPFAFEATNNFSQINVAKLAAFLGVTEAAGGTIKGGYFKFRGPPQQAARATASLRLEATNFQWETRQWDTLVLGATLINGRVEVPELVLVQGHNRLTLNGGMPLPAPGVAWWQAEFNANLSARIDNLTELSALLLPEFQYAEGRANIDGSIRGKDQQFDGQLIVSGSNLKWHNAPIEELHASVNLHGNECQLTNFSLFNNGDYLRGHGVVNIIGDKQYWGEVRASIEDLAKYAALLQKPILPEPLAGGAVIDWSGEGSAKGHSGKFSARLRKLRSLGATAALLHPINADLDGTYAPGTMQFSRFMLSDDGSSFTANVGLGNKALSLQGIKLYHRQALWLEGDALLPFDLWKAWPNTSLATLLDDQTVSKINLTAYNLSLREASLLTGWKFPIEGVVLGNFVAEGPVSALKTSGKFTIAKGQIPLGWSGRLLTGVEADAALDGQTLLVKKFAGKHPTGDFAASGQITFANVQDPTLQLSATTAQTFVSIFPQLADASRAGLAGQFQISGPCSAATISGEARVNSLELGPASRAAAPDLRALLLDGGPQPWPAIVTLNDAPWKAWQGDITLRTAQAVPVRWKAAAAGTIEADLRLSGSGAAPKLAGTATLRQFPVTVGATRLQLDEAALTFRDGGPSISARARGLAFGEPFAIHLAGSAQHPMRFFTFAPPLTEKAIRTELAGTTSTPPLEQRAWFGLRVPAELMEGVDLAEWVPIPTPGAAQ